MSIGDIKLALMYIPLLYNKRRVRYFSRNIARSVCIRVLGREGQAALSFTLGLGGIIIIVALLLTVYGLTFLSSSYGAQLSTRASYAVSSAARDAFLQLARSGDAVSSSYTTLVGSDAVYVTIQSDTPAHHQFTITATATVVAYTRTATAIAAVDATTGEFSLVSLSVP